MRNPPAPPAGFEASPLDVDSPAVPEGSSEDMMIDAAQAMAAKKDAPHRDRYGNGRYGKTGIHAHHGASHGGKKCK